MKKFNFIFKSLILTLSLLTLNSCDEVGDIDPGGTTTEAYAGEWFISIYDDSGNELVGHAIHATYNTSANDNTMWIDDDHNGWWLKSKFTIDLNSGQFSAESQENLQDLGSDVVITDGVIVKNGGTSKGGRTVDSIYFKAEFSYDPGNVLIFQGHKRTGFLDDQY